MSKPSTRRRGATAEEMSLQQREISVSEFFAKNRHLLGFDNARKSLLTAVKEAVDNALDACEEAGVLPDIRVELLQRSESRFKVTVRDNGPGIVRHQIENIFGRLLYGSKFHRLKMSRGQQGIGISAAGMYGLMTTGQPVLIISKTHRKKPAVEVLLKMDTSKNRADVVSETEHPEDDGLFADGHGTQVAIEMEGKYQQGRQSVDEYLDQTAIANPHAHITFITPSNETIEYKRGTNELPPEAKEILPHPKGIELGTLIQMIERTERSQVGGFLQEEFSRISPSVSKEICLKAGITPRTWVKNVGHAEAEGIYRAIQEAKIMAPATDCLVPIGTKALLSGLLKEVKAEFFTACTRPADVYRGNPFLIEVGLAFGGELPKDELIRVIRFANRVPLLYQQSACASFKAVLETAWRNYGISQSRASLPEGPIVVMIHMASVWVPFTSESKEAIADYDEIRKEMKLALQEVGRKLGIYLRRRQRMKHEGERRSIFERYLGEISQATEAITGTSAKRIYDSLLKVAKRKTEEADAVLDDEGKRVKDADPLGKDASVIILPARAIRANRADAPEETVSPGDSKRAAPGLFGDHEAAVKPKTPRRKG
ncbi:MAG: DNA topoisomerase VI subunit B [Phycisphaerales bacterium]|nr:DNA topoisomerase VI subunit B [Phycisphaerales bacterium]